MIPTATDGDVSFRGVNSRMNDSLLQPGEVSYSKNMRLTEHFAQVRKGHRRLGSDFDLSDAPLVLPFILGDTGSVAITGLAWAGNEVTVTVADASLFTAGMWVLISGCTPSGYNGNYEITAVVTGGGTEEFTYALTPNPGAATILGTAEEGPVVRDAYNDGVFTSGVYSDPNDDNAEYIMLATAEKMVFYSISAGTTSEMNYQAGSTLTAAMNPSITQAFDRVIIHRGPSNTALYWAPGTQDLATAIGAGDTFDPVPTSVTQPVELVETSVNITTAGKVEFTLASAHGLSTEDEVTIIDGGGTGLIEGDVYQVTKDTANNFHFYADVPSSSGAVVKVRAQTSVGGGYVAMPDAEYSVYCESRLWLPYNDGTSGGRDQIVASNLFDPDVYDPIYSSFRISKGTSDYLVAIYPYRDDSIIAFFRRSIHLLSGVSGSLRDVRVTELTREVGCVARKSIQAFGSGVTWLSDQGVYALQFGDELVLRGGGTPISAPINDIIQTINWASVGSVCCSAYVDNRYYLAFPTGSNTQSDTTIVFNLLNQSWESVDTYPAALNPDDLHIALSSGQRRRMLVNNAGGLYLCEEDAGGEDDTGNLVDGTPTSTTQVDGQLYTRRYILGMTAMKRWLFAHYQLEDDGGGTGSTLGVVLDVREPDSSSTVETATLTSGENKNVRKTLSKRGWGAQLQFTATAGRPRIKFVELEARPVGKQATERS